jgi:hypothetical protein
MKARSLSPFLGATVLALLSAIACGDDATVLPSGGAEAGNGGSAGSSDDDDDDDDDGDGGTAGSAGSGGSGGTAGSAGSGGGDGGVPPAGDVEVTGEIDEDTTWTADNTYILTGVVYVSGDSTLTIEPGTLIKGGGLGSALVITRGSRLVAEGTADDPIVFTSNITEGLRDAGDWGGVVLLGAAPINPEEGEEQIEGLDATEDRGTYGGDDAEHDCGSLQYVRIEFAGFEIGADNELNGLTVGGCGSDTVLDYIQVHRGLDDGIEFFGGTANVKHAVLTNNDDDSLDWDFGWSGNAQFMLIQHDDVHSDAGFEADNGPLAEVFDNEPRSAPTIYNLTMVGTEASTSPGMVLRRGTFGVIKNAIITGFPLGAIDVRDAASVAGTEEDPPALTIDNSIFFENGDGGTTHFGTTGTGLLEPTDAGDDDDDTSFDELVFFTDDLRANKIDEDPELPAPVEGEAPSFVPPADSPAATGAAPLPDDDFFDEADFIGALEPGGDDWTEGWTAYPAN